MNAWAPEYFAATGKQKVNGLLWRPVHCDEMNVFLSLLMVMGVNFLGYTCTMTMNKEERFTGGSVA